MTLTFSYSGKSKAEVNAFKEKRWGHFVAAFEEVEHLKVKYDKNIEDLCYLIKCCPLQHTGFFVETFTRRVVCFVGRCKLLSDGKCLRKHQVASEHEHILASDIGLHGSFESDEQDNECTTSLTMRSLSAMKYFNVFINQIIELEWNTKQLAITDMINAAYANFEADLLNILYDKQGIQKNSLVLKFKHERRVVIRFTSQSMKENSTVLGTDPNVWKSVDDVRIFQNLQPAVLQNILKGLINSPVGLDGALYNVVSVLKSQNETLDTADTSQDETEDSSLIPTDKNTSSSIETINASLGLGSRALGFFQQKKKSNNISAVLIDNSSAGMNSVESPSSNLTCNDEPSDLFLSNNSAQIDDDSDVNDSVGINLSRAKRKFLSNSNGNQNKGYFASSIDIFNPDSAWYTPNEFSTSVQKRTQKRRLNSSTVAMPTSEVVNTNKRTKANQQEVLAKSVAKRSLKSELRQATSKATYEVQLYRKHAASNVDFMGDIVSELGDCKISEALDALSLKSFSKNNCSSVSVAAAPSSTPLIYSDINTKEALEAVNKELDDKFVTFLIRHTTNAVAAEIALERFLVDYMMRKELLNGVKVEEQQLITNWRDIFLCIEDLIMRRIITESRNDEDKLTHAYNLSTTENFELLQQNMVLIDEMQTSESVVISDEEFYAQRKELREKSDAVHFALTAHYKRVIKLNCNTQQSLSRKVVRTLLNIAEKIVYLWSKFNGCLSDLLPEQVLEFSKKFEQQDTLEKALSLATKSQRLSVPEPSPSLRVDALPEARQVMSSSDQSISNCEESAAAEFACDQSSISLNQSSFSIERHIALVGDSASEKSHSERLEDVIRSIKVNPEQMKDFAKVLWTKTSRSLLVKPATTSSSKIPPSKAIVAAKDSVNVVSKEELSTPLPPSSEKSKAIFAEYFQLGGSSKSTGLSTSSTAVKMVPFPAVESISDTLKTYDDVMRIILHNVYACTGNIMLNLNYVFKKTDDQYHIASRMKLLQFLLSNRNRDAEEVMEEFSRTDLYSAFRCELYLRSPLASGSTIRGDGYCFFRAIFQLYCREKSGYVISTEDMTFDDQLRNPKPVDGIRIEEQFYTFVSDLKQLSKAVTPYLLSVYGEVQVFKFFEDLKLLKILLDVKPGCGLPTELWGNQLFVALLHFNVTGWTIVGSSKSKELQFKVPVDLMDQKWIKYYNTSLLTPKMVESRNYLTLTALDELCTVTPNFLCFDGSVHFFVVDNPTHSEFKQYVTDVKCLVMERLLGGVNIIVDVEKFLDIVDTIVVSLETNAPINVDKFNVEVFEHAFNVKFPFIPKTGCDDAIDLVDNDKELTANERLLTEKINTLEGKETILRNHNLILVDILKKKA